MTDRVKLVDPSWWLGLKGIRALGVYRSRREGLADRRVENGDLELRPVFVDKSRAAHALAVVTIDESGATMHGVFNDPTHATAYANAVGGHVSLMLVQWAAPTDEFAPMNGWYKVDPNIPGTA